MSVMLTNYKEKAKEYLDISNQFVLISINESKDLQSVVHANRVNSGTFLYALLQEVCDKWGEVVTSEVLTHFLQSRDNLREMFVSSLKEGE